jgi:hypothetical protein
MYLLSWSPIYAIKYRYANSPLLYCYPLCIPTVRGYTRTHTTHLGTITKQAKSFLRETGVAEEHSPLTLAHRLQRYCSCTYQLLLISSLHKVSPQPGLSNRMTDNTNLELIKEEIRRLRAEHAACREEIRRLRETGLLEQASRLILIITIRKTK